MKFNNFEKIKDIAKKTAIIGAGSLVMSSTSCKEGEQPIVQENNLNLTEANNPILKTENSISYEEAKSTFDQRNVDYYEGKDKKFNMELSQEPRKEIEISEENKILLQNIKKLEEKFANLSSNESFKINRGSISILSSLELGKMNGKESNLYPYSNSPSLDNRYITDAVSVLVFNKIENLKLLDKNFQTMDETYKLIDVGYIENKNGDNKFMHYIPEYYIVIDQTIKEDSINFIIKILSPEKSSIREINIEEKLPEETLRNEIELDNFVAQKIIPDIANNVEILIEKLNLNN